MIKNSLDFIEKYLEMLNESLKESDSALSKMLRWSLIPWNLLLLGSTKLLISRYNIHKGVLVVDDSDHHRSKKTTKIAHVHLIKDKKNEGYFRGQNLVFLLLVTESITIPVGFAFYEPDPEVSKWKAKDQILKEDSVKRMNRPKKPLRRKDYPTKQELALNLLTKFFKFHTQLIRNKRGLLIDVKSHFEVTRADAICRKIFIRGGKEEIVFINAQKLWVDAIKQKEWLLQ